MNSITIETLAEFTKFMEENFIDQSDVLFRGQAGEWPLIPSIARQRLTDDILKVEQLMLEDFQRLSVPYIKTIPETTWDWIALAQHHGLPTRLLDWSINPFAALWFAVNQPVKQGDNGIVWIFRPLTKDMARESNKKIIESKRHLVFNPKHITERITAQLAYFTIHKSWAAKPEFEPMENSKELKNQVSKIAIPVKRFAHFRFHLNRFGMNDASVFPGLDGLCDHIKWKWCFFEDEGEK